MGWNVLPSPPQIIFCALLGQRGPGTGALVMIFIVLELWPSLEKSRLWAKEELRRAGHLPPHLRLLQFQLLREKPGTNREQ